MKIIQKVAEGGIVPKGHISFFGGEIIPEGFIEIEKVDGKTADEIVGEMKLNSPHEGQIG